MAVNRPVTSQYFIHHSISSGINGFKSLIALLIFCIFKVEKLVNPPASVSNWPSDVTFLTFVKKFDTRLKKISENSNFKE